MRFRRGRLVEDFTRRLEQEFLVLVGLGELAHLGREGADHLEVGFHVREEILARHAGVAGPRCIADELRRLRAFPGIGGSGIPA